MHPISFTANYLNSTPIKAKENGRFRNKEVAFVEFDRSNLQDRAALRTIGDEWEDTYAAGIYNKFFNEYPQRSIKVFGITTQEDNFDEMDPEKVLCLAEIADYPYADDRYLEYLQNEPSQISPEYYQNNPVNRFLVKHFSPLFDNREYKNVGKAMIKELQKKFDDKPITLCSVEHAIGFYENLGFKVKRTAIDSSKIMEWRKEEN